MKGSLLYRVVLAVLCPAAGSFAQTGTPEVSHRISITAGMGANYHNAQDIVNLINSNSLITRRVDDFQSGVEFFGTFGVPLSPDWEMKVEYVYLIASYSEGTPYGNAEFSYSLHMPTLIGQYVLHAERTYNFKAGIGFGYHFGAYTQKYSLVDGTYKGSGLGALIELEGNTALGDDVFAHLGTQIRWDFVGDLKNGAGQSPGGTFATSLHFFSVGARLGVTVYL
jgi:hypothetical protein